MRTISSSLKEKLEKKIQTIATNANPQMEVIAYRANRYLVQGNYLSPKTVQTGNILGPIDVCISRPVVEKDPDKIHICYMEDNLLKTASMNYQFSAHDNFKYDRTVPTPSGCEGLTINDIACDFDGTWVYIYKKMMYDVTKTRWALQTYSNMSIAVVYGDKLIVHEKDGSITTLCESGVLKCSLLKGWKSVSEILSDQGLICAYVKTDAKAYYRSYCELADGTYLWEPEREITDVANVKNISIFRTNDYRVCFAIETSDTTNNMIIKVSKRSWSGMASDRETVNCTMLNKKLVAKVKPITYSSNYKYENVNAAVKNFHIVSDILPLNFDATILTPTAERKDLNKLVITFPYEISEIDLSNTMFKLDNGLTISNIAMETGNRILSITLNREVMDYVDIKITYSARSIVVKSDDWTAHVRSFTITAKGVPPEVKENVTVNMSNRQASYVIKDVSRPDSSVTDSAQVTIKSFYIKCSVIKIEDIPV